jgi:broad specificity phosphatase PhoE
MKYTLGLTLSTPEMTEHTYIFMRHGEAEHNVAAARDGDAAYTDPAYTDAPLTAKGREQVLESARELLKTYPQIDLIWSSPLTRTIQTARCVQEIIPVKAKKILLSDALIECQGGHHICNQRLSKEELTAFNPDVDTKDIVQRDISSVKWYLTRPREDNITMRWRGHSFIHQVRSPHRVPAEVKKAGPLVILVVTHHEVLNAWFEKKMANAEVHIAPLSAIKVPNRLYTGI